MGHPHQHLRGRTAPITGSPVGPQTGPGGVTPVRIVHGFTTRLPGRSRRFFQRNFFAAYPRPIQQAPGNPFPRDVVIAAIEAPARQSIVIRRVSFKAFENTGGQVEDYQQIPDSQTIGTYGFKFLLGNQNIADYITNLPAATATGATFGGQISDVVAPRSGQGSVYQGTGIITPTQDADPFAAYAMPGAPIVASAVILRPPPQDVRFFEVNIEGWLAEEKELQSIIDSLSR